MKKLAHFIESTVSITPEEFEIVKKHFVFENCPPKTILLKEGQVAHYAYFLTKGIVKGYQNMDGKIVVQHLIDEDEIFTSLESFMHKIPSTEYYETITDCEILKISRSDFDFLSTNTSFWSKFVEITSNDRVNCKLERVKDFQMLTAKERYIKFVDQFPNLALNVSVDNIASFLGIEPQSLSRIRKQITF